MHHNHMTPTASCSVCTQTECPLSEGTCPEEAEESRKIQGWRFSGMCVLVFLSPIALAIFGSLLFPENKTYGLLAGFAGFILGAALSAGIARIAGIEGKAGLTQ